MFIFVYFFTQTDPTRTVQRSALCRSRRELSNAYFLAKFGFDTAVNEPCKVCPLSAYRSPRFRDVMPYVTVHVLLKKGTMGKQPQSMKFRFDLNAGRNEHEGWSYHQDLQTGYWYWHHAPSGENEWAETDPSAESDTREGWTRYQDPETGYWYWHHEASGDSKWADGSDDSMWAVGESDLDAVPRNPGLAGKISWQMVAVRT